MTSKENLIKTLNHEQPDRVVVDFGATPVTGTHVLMVEQLRAHFGLEKKPIRVTEPFQMLGEIDEAHVHETSYVRFRELSLGYSLPGTVLANTFMDAVSISIIGRNLFLWTDYPNFDPETSTTGAVNGQGIEYVAHPQIASFGGRLNITF
jgi:hypothetical protein